MTEYDFNTATHSFGAATEQMRETPVDGNVIDLSEMAGKASGAWPRGWYPAEIIEGYRQGGYEFSTGSKASKKGDSYNLLVCFRVSSGADVRTMFKQINYRTADFEPETIEAIRNLRKEFAGVRGKWDGFADEQRTSLALAEMGQLAGAAQVPFSLNDGIVNAAPFIGRSLYVRLTIDEDSGYNEITGVSQFPNGVEPREKSKRRSKRS